MVPRNFTAGASNRVRRATANRGRVTPATADEFLPRVVIYGVVTDVAACPV
jgi:hypothetical protein